MVNFRRHQQEWHLKQIAKKYRNNYRSYPETRVFHIKHQGLLQLPVVQWLVSLQKRLQSTQTTWNRRMSCALWRALRFESRNVSTCECAYHCVTVELLTAMQCQIVITNSEFLWGIEWNNMELIFQNDTSSNKSNMLMTGSHPWFPSGFTGIRGLIPRPYFWLAMPIGGRTPNCKEIILWGRCSWSWADTPHKPWLGKGSYAVTQPWLCLTAMKGI